MICPLEFFGRTFFLHRCLILVFTETINYVCCREAVASTTLKTFLEINIPVFFVCCACQVSRLNVAFHKHNICIMGLYNIPSMVGYGHILYVLNIYLGIYLAHCTSHSKPAYRTGILHALIAPHRYALSVSVASSFTVRWTKPLASFVFI